MATIIHLLANFKGILTPAFEIQSTHKRDIITIRPLTNNQTKVVLSIIYHKPQEHIEVYLNGHITNHINTRIVSERVLHGITGLSDYVGYALLPYLISTGTEIEGVSQERTFQIIKRLAENLEQAKQEYTLTGITGEQVDVTVHKTRNKTEVKVTDDFYVRGVYGYEPLTLQNMV